MLDKLRVSKSPFLKNHIKLESFTTINDRNLDAGFEKFPKQLNGDCSSYRYIHTKC